MRILRHQIGITDYQVIELPAKGQLLSVAMSRALPNMAIDLWSVDHEHGQPHEVAVYVIGTGNPMPNDLARELDPPEDSLRLVYPLQLFLGTVVTPNGLVRHIFQRPLP